MAKILIVDDSKFSRSMIRKVLVSTGYEIAEATNGQEGLEMVSSYRPDAVTVDLLMPELDGLGFLSSLRKSGNQLPAVVITADIQVDVRQQCEDFGAVFLQKPFKGSELVAALATYGIKAEAIHGT